MTYRTYVLSSLPPEWRKRCRQLTLRDGDMWPTFCQYENRNWRLSRAVLAHADDGTILGWALIFQPARGIRWNVHVYVDRAHRRKGIGTRLISHARIGRKGSVGVFPWDSRSRAALTPFMEIGKAHDAY